MTIARRLWQVVVGIVREISDQSSYERYLQAHARVHSPAEWRRFSDEKARLKFQRPKCC